MKTIIIALALMALLALVGCVKPKQQFTDCGPEFVIANSRVYEFKHRGHSYLLADAMYANSMLHAEHCACKTNSL